MNKFRLSLRYTIRYAGRYIFLFCVLALGFGLITVMTGFSDGMRTAVYESATRHYGGDVFILGASKEYGTFFIVDAPDVLENLVAESGVDYIQMHKRTNLVNKGFVYFNGSSVRQKNILGVDFDKETQLLSGLNISEGSYPDSENEIIISHATAAELEARIGDELVLKVPTKTGQINTGSFTVAAIAADSGIFGAFRVIGSRSQINKLLNIPANQYSVLGFELSAGSNHRDAASLLYENISTHLESVNIHTKNDLTKGLAQNWNGVQYFILPLEVYISQVSDLLLAMDLASYVLFLLIAVIIIVSVYVSFNVLLKDRTSEFASMRAIGMQRNDLIMLVVGEAGILFVLALAAGSVFSIIVFTLTAHADFSFIPGFELFLQQGKLQADISITRSVTNILILLLSIIPAVLIPVKRLAYASVQQGLQEGME